MSTPPTTTRVEQVVLLDESGAAIGAADKSGVHGLDTPLHLAFSCYVVDDGGERLLLTRRAVAKTTWGGWWTNSCCGHPAPGEPLEDAVRRRVDQELGLALTDLRLVLPAFRYRATVPDGPAAGTVENEMCPVFVAVAASPVRPDPVEVEDHTWVAWADFRARALAGETRVSPWCVEQVALLPTDLAGAPAADPASLPPAAIVRHDRPPPR